MKRFLKGLLSLKICLFLAGAGLAQTQDLTPEEKTSLAAVEAFSQRSQFLESQLWPNYFFHRTPLILQSDERDILINFAREGYGSVVAGLPPAKLGGLELALKKEKYLSVPVGMIFPLFIERQPIFFPYLPVKSIAQITYKQLNKRLDLNYDLYMISWYHEAFHAYQMQNWQPFSNLLVDQKKYLAGFEGKQWLPLLKLEGESLYRAVTATTPEATWAHLQAFFERREHRRQQLPAKIIEMEKIFELVEGTAQYVERKAALALLQNPPEWNHPDYHRFRHAQAMLNEKLELVRTLEFDSPVLNANWAYNWGMAQALILDRLDPAWQKAMNQRTFFLEDKLRSLQKQYSPKLNS